LRHTGYWGKIGQLLRQDNWPVIEVYRLLGQDWPVIEARLTGYWGKIGQLLGQDWPVIETGLTSH